MAQDKKVSLTFGTKNIDLYSYEKVYKFIKDRIEKHAEKNFKSFNKNAPKLHELIKSEDKRKEHLAGYYIDMDYFNLLYELYYSMRGGTVNKDIYGEMLQKFANACYSGDIEPIKNEIKGMDSKTQQRLNAQEIRNMLQNGDMRAMFYVLAGEPYDKLKSQLVQIADWVNNEKKRHSKK